MFLGFCFGIAGFLVLIAILGRVARHYLAKHDKSEKQSTPGDLLDDLTSEELKALCKRLLANASSSIDDVIAASAHHHAERIVR